MLQDLIKETGEILERKYSELKLDPRFTIWGVSYFWNKNTNSFQETPVDSESKQIIPYLFDQALSKRQLIVRPRNLAPKSRDEVSHYLKLSLRNWDLITREFLNELSPSEALRNIVSDKTTLDSIAREYIDTVKSKKIPETVDFYDFCLYFDGEDAKENRTPNGKYRHILERIVLRFEEEDPLVNLPTLIDPEIYREVLSLTRAAAESKRPRIDPNLINACNQYVDDTVPEEPGPITGIGYLLGRRRVKLGNNSHTFTDWEEYARQRSAATRINIDPVKMREVQLVNAIFAQFEHLYREDPNKAIAELNKRAQESANPAEQKALNTTARLLQLTFCFKNANYFNKKMIISRRK